MSHPNTITELIAKTISGDHKCYEPKERLCAGRFGFVRHRFAIKGGISTTEVMARNLSRNNALLSRLMAKDGK